MKISFLDGNFLGIIATIAILPVSSYAYAQETLCQKPFCALVMLTWNSNFLCASLRGYDG